MVEEILAARGIIVGYDTVRQWALKFGQDFANRIRRRCPVAADRGGSAALDKLKVTPSRATRRPRAYETGDAGRLASQKWLVYRA